MRSNSLSGWKNFPCYHTVLIQVIEFYIGYLKSPSGWRRWVTGGQYLEPWKFVKEWYWTKSCSVTSILGCLPEIPGDTRKEGKIHTQREKATETIFRLTFSYFCTWVVLFSFLQYIIKPIWISWKTCFPFLLKTEGLI